MQDEAGTWYYLVSQIATSCLSSWGRALNKASLKRFTLARNFFESPSEFCVDLGSSRNTILNTTNCKAYIGMSGISHIQNGE